jgi:DMSO/TMAO reductase YedYZ molybdopterin-dependent catalytic subunit
MSARNPGIDEVVESIDADEAVQRAIRAGLVMQRSDPLNCEIPVAGLIAAAAMPTAHHYVRNHFRIPSLDPASWRLTVAGLVEHPLTLSLDDLRGMPSQSLGVTLECAGNGRSTLRPPVEGEPWGLGAVSTAEWTGVPLSEVLNRAGVKPTATELIFRGADGGTIGGHSGITRFERSLTLDEIRDFQPLLAFAMNGEPLPVEHGFPLRVVVPRWYGVASVKWLTEIDVTDVTFRGYFQHERYFYEWDDKHRPREPVTIQRVRALITEPRPNQQIERGNLTLRGVAWSGAAPIARVEVSAVDGSWEEAHLIGKPMRYSWQWWELARRAEHPGTVTIRVRATDAAGRTQPEQPEWNRLGYGANAIQEVTVQIR